MKSIEKKLRQHFKPVSWNPDCLNFEFIEQRLKEGVDNKMMLTLANKSYISGIIKDITDIAYSKFSANAFLHWYYKCGLEKTDFENAFLIMDNIASNYSSLKWDTRPPTLKYYIIDGSEVAYGSLSIYNN